MAFGRVGLLSFGGGSASQLLLHKEVLWKHDWFEEAEFNRVWQLSKLSLGINQIAQVILYGKRLAGWRGIVVAVAGFVLPAVTATVALSVVLVAVIGNRFVEEALRVIIPLTGGMTAAVAMQMWGPEIHRGDSARQWLRLLWQGSIVFACGVLVGAAHVPVPLVMLAAIAAGALAPA